MKYTASNPKKVRSWFNTDEQNFTGVVKDNRGTIAYYENGECHRLNNPAVIYSNGNMAFYKNNMPHKEDGPAVIRAAGQVEYWIDGIQLLITTDKELKDYLILRMFE